MDGNEKRRTDWFAQFDGTPGRYTIFAEVKLDGATKLGFALDGNITATEHSLDATARSLGYSSGFHTRT